MHASALALRPDALLADVGRQSRANAKPLRPSFLLLGLLVLLLLAMCSEVAVDAASFRQ